ncbi:hypothetical protein CTA2_12292, partial [Colletotrichum tanaceti]
RTTARSTELAARATLASAPSPSRACLPTAAARSLASTRRRATWPPSSTSAPIPTPRASATTALATSPVLAKQSRVLMDPAGSILFENQPRITGCGVWFQG